jgi:transposase-like protein
MAKQNSLSLIEFQDKFSSEEACQEHLFAMKWPNGFKCPKCGHEQCYFIETRKLYQCKQCHYQSSLTANTVMHRTRTPLRIWFWMIYLLSRDKRGKSTLSLSKELNINYPKAWTMTQKIRAAMSSRDAHYKLAGLVEMDESYFGGPTNGRKRGRGTDKSKVLIAVSLNQDGKPQYAKMQVVDELSQEIILKEIKKQIEQGSTIQTDNFQSYARVFHCGYAHKRLVSDTFQGSDLFQWVHVLASNAKGFIQGTYHGLDKKHLQAYLDEFCFRFNRRFWEPQLFNRLLSACLVSKALSYADLIE